MTEMVKVTKVVKNPGSTTLVIHFSNGKARKVDFAKYAHEGPVFAHLVEPDYVNSVRRLEHGFGIEWPDGMDMSAGAVARMGTALAERSVLLEDGKVVVLNEVERAKTKIAQQPNMYKLTKKTSKPKIKLFSQVKAKKVKSELGKKK